MKKWYQFLITWRTIFKQLTWQSTNHVNHFCMIKLKYGIQNKYRPPNFQWNCSKKCISWFENKHTQAYTRKMGDSVLWSYSHWRGCRNKWMAQIWDNQSNLKKYPQGRPIWKLDCIRSIFIRAWFQKDKLWLFFNLCQKLSVDLCRSLLAICKRYFLDTNFVQTFNFIELNPWKLTVVVQ